MMSVSKGRIVLVIGGARSGKSSFALRSADSINGKKAYIATAQAFDSEMEQRIQRHKNERPDDWSTIEEPLNIASAIGEAINRYDVVLIDCLTLWLSNLMHAGRDIDKEIDRFVNFLKAPELRQDKYELFLVSNEVGMGIVPENSLSRQFRDFAGILNQKVAQAADEVYLMAAGIATRIK